MKFIFTQHLQKASAVKQKLFMVPALATFFLLSCIPLDSTVGNGEDSPLNIEAGLQQALDLGARVATEQLGEKDGYLGDALVRILLPEEVAEVFDAVDEFEDYYGEDVKSFASALNIPDDYFTLSRYRDSIYTSLNRAAEEAAPHGLQIFQNVISNMTIQEARDILFGPDTAATHYLKEQSWIELENLFQPIIKDALDKVKANSLWSSFSSKYNGLQLKLTELDDIPLVNVNELVPVEFPQELPTDLSTYTTTKALDGVFVKISDQETLLRENPLDRLQDLGEVILDGLDEDLIYEVFDLQD